MNNVETIVLIAVVLLALFFILPSMMNRNDHFSNHISQSPYSSNNNEGFIDTSSQEIIMNRNSQIYPNTTQNMKMYNDNKLNSISIPLSSPDNVSGYDPTDSQDGGLTPRGENKNYESLIFDNTTGSIMTGSQFMENTGLITPPWVAPAWNPDAYGPSSKIEMNFDDYDNDSRMLYNKCSLSCCSEQYPTPFQMDKDPFVFDKDGNRKYLASNYICQNNTGGTGCLCMSQKQVDGMHNGFVDYYVDKDNLGY
jgi:hypothetical protein